MERRPVTCRQRVHQPPGKALVRHWRALGLARVLGGQRSLPARGSGPQRGAQYIPDPTAEGFHGKSIQDYTHAHFPQQRFDEVRLDGNYAFGRTGETYGAFVALNDLHYFEDTTDDLVQPGRETFWVFEAGSAASDGDFDAFVARIKSNPVSYDAGRLSYASHGRELVLEYQGEFTIDGEVQNLDYPRFDSAYAQVPRKPESMSFAFKGQSLYLDFYNQKREVSPAN